MIDPIVSPEWVLEHRDEVVLCDVRWYLDGRSGLEAYQADHIAGAVFVSIDTDLAAHDQPITAGRHPLPSPEAFADALGRLGISDGDVVVAYDDSGGGTAGRLVVMLRSIGCDAALLDGGLNAWGGDHATGDEHGTPVTRTARPWPTDRFPDADHTAAAALAEGPVVIDARGVERYRGDSFALDPRAGHIPGAKNLHWASLLDPATGRFRDRSGLRERFAAVGIAEGTDVIASCGSGVSACADLVAMEAAGLGLGRLFVASWSGWASDPARSVETGEGAP